MVTRRWFDRPFPAGRRRQWEAEIAAPGPGPRRFAHDSAEFPFPPAPRLAGQPSTTATPCERVLLVNQYYWPDHASTAQHLTDLAESLIAEGYECHVLASQSRYRPGEPKPVEYEVHRGVHIHRVPATSLGRRGTWRA